MKIIYKKVWGLGIAVEPFESTTFNALDCKLYLGPWLFAHTIYYKYQRDHED